MATVKVLIVDDEGLFRDLLLKALSSVASLDVVGAAQDGTEAIEMAQELEPDVVVMDIELGSEPNGIQAGHRIRRLRPDTGVVILSMHKDRQYVASLLEGEARGWSYLLKQSITDTTALVRAVEAAAAEMVLIDVEVLKELRARPNSAMARLTQREGEALELMAQGYREESIAQRMDESPEVVRQHIDAILRKLEIDQNGPVHPWVKAVLSFLNETRVGGR